MAENYGFCHQNHAAAHEINPWTNLIVGGKSLDS
jgi:hypothetical protein